MQALRHSKVKLTWDQDDPERERITRRALSLKEIEENDFHAYVASSTDTSSDDETSSAKKTVSRDKLRALLLSGGGNDLPEGWAGSKIGDMNKEGDGDDMDMDMEVTFRPALSGGQDEEETTIGKYQRKMREKRKKRKQELKDSGRGEALADDFFVRSEGEQDSDGESLRGGKKDTRGEQRNKSRKPSTKEELSLLVAPDRPGSEPKHFDMAAIIKAEKKGKSRGRRKETRNDDENELQDDFDIDVKDERFRALHEDHAFAIDPSNPQ
jgi:hypothetical protein